MKKFTVLILVVFSAISLCGCKAQEVKLSSYEISATLNDDMTLNCDMIFNYYNNTESEVSELVFSLYPNAFSSDATVKPVHQESELSAYPYGVDYGKIEILSVTENGEKTSFNVSGTNNGSLKIALKSPVKNQTYTTIYVKFNVELPCVNHRFGYGNDTVNLTGFYPVLCVQENGKFYESVYYPNGDPFYSECANYKVKLTLPSTYSVASSMSAVKTEWSGGETTYYYERENVRDVAFIASERFKIVKTTRAGVEVSYYYYTDKNPDKTLETAAESLTFFSEKFYKYPYAEYVVTEGDFIYGGMEYPCLSLISDALSDSSRDYTVAHETAHQWWYGIVGVNESEIGYLDEGLTEFSTAYYIGESKRFSESYAELITRSKEEYIAIKNALIYSGNLTPPVMERNLKDFASEAEYVMIAYNRSQIMVDSLKEYMGNKKFFAFLKAFVSENSYKNVTTATFIGCAEKNKKGAGEIIRGFVSGVTDVK